MPFPAINFFRHLLFITARAEGASDWSVVAHFASEKAQSENIASLRAGVLYRRNTASPRAIARRRRRIPPHRYLMMSFHCHDSRHAMRIACARETTCRRLFA